MTILVLNKCDPSGSATDIANPNVMFGVFLVIVFEVRVHISNLFSTILNTEPISSLMFSGVPSLLGRIRSKRIFLFKYKHQST